MTRILLVVGDPANLATDESGQALYDHFTGNGDTVTTRDDGLSAPADVNSSYDLVFITNSCASSMNLSTLGYDACTVPVVATGVRSPHSKYATVTPTNGATQDTVYLKTQGVGDPCVPPDLTTAQTVTVLDSVFTSRYVYTTSYGPDKHEIASVDSANLPNLSFTRYNAGEMMTASTTAPSKRAWFLLHPGSIGTNTRGWQFIDLMVAWATGVSIVVSVGPDQTIYTGQTATVTCTATGGTGTLSYSWTKVSGPSGTFGSATSSTTTFTPSAAGSYILRCSVTDGSDTITDDLVLTVNAPSATGGVGVVVTSTNWTPTPDDGTPLEEILTDDDGATYLTSAANPSAQVLEVILNPVTAPTPGSNMIVSVGADAIGASSTNILAKLYQGSTLISTVTGLTIPTGSLISPVSGAISIIFPAADLTHVTSWTDGLKVRLEVTSAV